MFATHDPRVIHYARRVITLRDGRIIENAAAEETASEKTAEGMAGVGA